MRTPRGIVVGLLTSALALVAFAVPSAHAETWKGHPIIKCDSPTNSRDNGVTSDRSRITNNVFGPGAYGCLKVTGPSSFVTTTNLKFSSQRVQWYPNDLYGCTWGQCTPHAYLPMRVSQARKLQLWMTAYANGPPGQAGGYQGDFDGYFYKTRSTKVHGAAELVIVTQFGIHHKRPAPRHHRRHRHHPPIWPCTGRALMWCRPGALADSLSATLAVHPAVAGTYHGGGIVMVGGLKYTFIWWTTSDPKTGFTWPLLFFHLLKPDGHVHAPIGKFTAIVVAAGVVPRTWWLGGMRYGFECWNGCKGAAVHLVVAPLH